MSESGKRWVGSAMAGDRHSVEIGSVAEIYDGPHATPKTVEEGPIFLGIDSLDNGRLNLAATRHVTEEDFEIWSRRVKPAAGDLVFSYETRIGQAALIPKGLRCCLGRRLALIRPDHSKLSSRYLLYYYLSPHFQEFLRSRTMPGSTVDRIHLRNFPSFPIVLPPLSEQQQIANLLGSIDDKIELHRRMAETLETMAHALFKSWFVNFEPVRAKSEGRSTGLCDNLAALFPDDFAEDGLPLGWRREPLLFHARLISGGTPKTEEAAYWDGPILWASAKDVSQCRDQFLIGTERTITERGLEESATRLIPRLSTVVVARGATTGRHCMVGRDMAMNQTCYALSSRSSVPFWLYCTFGWIVDELIQAAHGSVFDTITTTTLGTSRVTAGDEAIVKAFENQVSPLFDRILSSIDESLVLKSLRDTLLSRLISGELRIADAEKRIVAA
jgi:type I restriction enzyme S subunit